MSVLVDVAGVLSAAAGFPIVKANQKQAGAPRAAAAAALYGTVQFLSSAATSATPISSFAAAAPPLSVGDKTLSQVRLGTLIVDVYGDGAFEALEALQLAVRRRSVRLAAWQEDAQRPMVLTPTGVVQSLPVLRSTSWDEHAQAEFQLQWVQTDVEAMERIETVEVTVEVDDAGGTPLETLVITVDYTDTPP